jgi:hypothetical protein
MASGFVLEWQGGVQQPAFSILSVAGWSWTPKDRTFGSHRSAKE